MGALFQDRLADWLSVVTWDSQTHSVFEGLNIQTAPAISEADTAIVFIL
jgi:hypothetical protein